MTRNLSTRLAVAVLLSLAAAAVANAGDPIEHSQATSDRPLVTIENLFGSVVIKGWEKNEVSLTGTLGEGTEGLDFSGSKDRVDVEVQYPDRDWNGRNEETELILKVPLRAGLEIEGVNLRISVSNFLGTAEAETVNGTIRIGGSPEAVYAQNINGEILIHGDCPRVETESVSGSIELRGSQKEASAETVSGSIEAYCTGLEEGEFDSVSGSIRFEGTLTDRGSLDIECHSGSVTVVLPADVSADIDVSTFSGEIDNEFGQKAERTDRYAPGKELSFMTGPGDARISIDTFSGTVHLEKQK